MSASNLSAWLLPNFLLPGNREYGSDQLEIRARLAKKQQGVN
jgi:hypothetical protein